MEIRFHDQEYLATILGVDRQSFHRSIKPQIIRDFRDELESANIQNPDIGLNDNEEIILADPNDHTRTIETKTSINLYKENNE